MRWHALQTGKVYVQQNPEDGQLTTEDLQNLLDGEGKGFDKCVLHYAAILQENQQYRMQQRAWLISIGYANYCFTYIGLN